MSGSVGEDAALLAAVATGDRDALAELYRRHAPWLKVRLSRRCPDRDVVAEAFRTHSSPRGGGRAGGRVPATSAGGCGGSRSAGWWTRWRGAGPRRSPWPNRWRRRRRRRSWCCCGLEHSDVAGPLNELSPELRAVVQAAVLDGLSTREAARLLGVPRGTVKTRMRRARLQLREALT